MKIIAKWTSRHLGTLQRKLKPTGSCEELERYHNPPSENE